MNFIGNKRNPDGSWNTEYLRYMSQQVNPKLEEDKFEEFNPEEVKYPENEMTPEEASQSVMTKYTPVAETFTEPKYEPIRRTPNPVKEYPKESMYPDISNTNPVPKNSMYPNIANIAKPKQEDEVETYKPRSFVGEEVSMQNKLKDMPKNEGFSKEDKAMEIAERKAKEDPSDSFWSRMTSNPRLVAKMADAIVKIGGALGGNPNTDSAFESTTNDILDMEEKAAANKQAGIDRAKKETRDNILFESQVRGDAIKQDKDILGMNLDQKKQAAADAKNDPNSPVNVAMRNSLSSILPKYSAQFEGMGYTEMMDIYNDLSEKDKLEATNKFNREKLKADINADNRRMSESERSNRAREYGDNLDRQARSEDKALSRQDRDPNDKAPKYSDSQSKAASFAQRMEQAEGDLVKLEGEGYERSDFTAGLTDTMLPNFIKSDENQRQNQAERNFVNALLRRESGAAIGKDEFTSAEQQYFPRAGDSKEVVEQKRRNRLLATEGIKTEAGGAYDLISPKTEGSKGDGVTLRKDGKVVTVYSSADYNEAQKEGWR